MPYPTLDLSDLARAIQKTHDRLLSLRTAFEAYQEAQKERANEIKDRLDGLTRELAEHREAVVDMERRLSVEGLRTEAFGLMLVGVGLAMQLLAQVLG